MSSHFLVRNWERWQSYRSDRGQPPWIKLHRALMSNWEWRSLSDAEKGQLVLIWLCASEHNGCIPDDARALQRACGMDEPPDLERLLELQFLERPKKRRRQGGAKSTPTRRQLVPLRIQKTEDREESLTAEKISTCEGSLNGDAPKNSAPGVWDLGAQMLGNRGLLGRLIRDHGDECVKAAITRTLTEQPADAKTFLLGCVRSGSGPPARGKYETAHERVRRLNGGGEDERVHAGDGRGTTIDGHAETVDAPRRPVRRE